MSQTMRFLPARGSRDRIIRNLRHLDPPTQNKFISRRRKEKWVPPKDRVPFWNIFPGDEVRVNTGCAKITHADGRVEKVPYRGIVDTIDLKTNQVRLRAIEGVDDASVPRNLKHMPPRLLDPQKGEEGGWSLNVAFIARPVHYSNLSLRLPTTLQLPKDAGLDEKALQEGVYASRLERGPVKFNPKYGHFTYKRYAIVPTDEGNLKIEVPFLMQEKRAAALRPNSTMSASVDKETWLPWMPSDPTFVLPKRAHTSPHAVQRQFDSLAARAQSHLDRGILTVDGTNPLRGRAGVASTVRLQMGPDATVSQDTNIPGGSDASAGLPMYVGFTKQLLSKVRRPILPQPATPAEVVWMANHEARSWQATNAPTETVTADPEAELYYADDDEAKTQTFSALDYLDVAPLEGPNSITYAGLASPSASRTKPLARHPTTARLVNVAEAITKREVDNWPIELMMTEDLTNEHSTNNKRKRWLARKAEAATKAKQDEADRLAVLKDFRKIQL